MESQKEEISIKVKSAVKQKLVELGSYVDDELPEYIMVLVANKKTKTQMDEDLMLFLGNKTKEFTKWLHNILEILSNASESKFLEVGATESDDTSNVSNFASHALHKDVSMKEDKQFNEKLTKKSKSEKTYSSKMKSQERNISAKPLKPKRQLITFGENQSRIVSTCDVPSVICRPNSQLSKEKKMDTESSLSSKVLVAPRPKRPVSSQASKFLILKAVADANRSVNLPRKRPLEEESAPKKMHCSNVHTIQRKIEVEDNDVEMVSDNEDKFSGEAAEKRRTSQKIESKDSSRDAIDMTSPTNQPVSFFVTLNGSMPKKAEPANVPESVDEECIEEIEEWEEIHTDMSTVNKQLEILPLRKEERCKFWPNCKDEINCQFVHPNRPCKTFPKCSFGQKCLFIHPRCKYSLSCKKLNCPFMHTAGKNFNYSGKHTTATVNCKFYPNCIDVNCPFIHPKICRFGKFCQTPNCTFGHPEVSKSSKFRWVAPSNGSKLSETTAT